MYIFYSLYIYICIYRYIYVSVDVFILTNLFAAFTWILYYKHIDMYIYIYVCFIAVPVLGSILRMTLYDDHRKAPAGNWAPFCGCLWEASRAS